MRADFFATDHELVTDVARAVTVTEVQGEIRDYQMSTRYSNWLHRVAKFRVSGRRLLALAESLGLDAERDDSSAKSDSRDAHAAGPPPLRPRDD